MPVKKVVKKAIKKGAKKATKAGAKKATKAVVNKKLDKLPPALKKAILKAKAKKKK